MSKQYELILPEELVAQIKFDALKEYVVRKGVQPTESDAAITKEELREQLLLGRCLYELLPVRDGQECEIVKVKDFLPGNTVIYMPDLWMSNVPVNELVTDLEMLEEVVSYCYTGDDFIAECNGDVEKAKDLFHYVDWQHPSSAVDEIFGD